MNEHMSQTSGAVNAATFRLFSTDVEIDKVMAGRDPTLDSTTLIPLKLTLTQVSTLFLALNVALRAAPIQALAESDQQAFELWMLLRQLIAGQPKKEEPMPKKKPKRKPKNQPE